MSRALVQYCLHKRDGTAARFVIGVRRGQGPLGTPQNPGPSGATSLPLDAHAWVEAFSANQEANGSADEQLRYQPVLSSEQRP